MMITVMAVAITASATDVDTVLKDLKARIAPDGRVAIWNLTTTIDGDVAVIDGTVGYQDQLDAINAEKMSDIEKANAETEKANTQIANLQKQIKAITRTRLMISLFM